MSASIEHKGEENKIEEVQWNPFDSENIEKYIAITKELTLATQKLKKYIEDEKKKMKPLKHEQKVWKTAATSFMKSKKKNNIIIPKIGSWKFVDTNTTAKFNIPNLASGLALFCIQKKWVPNDVNSATDIALEALNFAKIKLAKNKTSTLRYFKTGKAISDTITADPKKRLLELQDEINQPVTTKIQRIERVENKEENKSDDNADYVDEAEE